MLDYYLSTYFIELKDCKKLTSTFYCPINIENVRIESINITANKRYFTDTLLSRYFSPLFISHESSIKIKSSLEQLELYLRHPMANADPIVF